MSTPSRAVPAVWPIPLAPRQRELLTFLYEYTKCNGFQPGFREMMLALKSTSLNSPRLHLRALQRKGWIETSPRDSRCIRILFRPDGRPFEGFADR